MAPPKLPLARMENLDIIAENEPAMERELAARKMDIDEDYDEEGEDAAAYAANDSRATATPSDDGALPSSMITIPGALINFISQRQVSLILYATFDYSMNNLGFLLLVSRSANTRILARHPTEAAENDDWV